MARGRISTCFFYLSLFFGEEGRQTRHAESGSGYIEGFEHVIAAYGVNRFFSEIDEGRSYRTQGGIIGESLAYVAGEGFKEFSEKYKLGFGSIREFRERYILEALRGS